MSDQAPTIGDPHDDFVLPDRRDHSLSQLVEQAAFDDVHFFLAEALADDQIDIAAAGDDERFYLFPYEHLSNAIDDDAFDLIEEAGYEHATLHDLLNLAIERPDLQRDFDVVALGTMRTRQIFKDREGETTWDQSERDKSICQWATGLSNLKDKRTLIPVEIYLDDVLRKSALLLVKTS